jgi:hypothetical protein
MPPADVHVGRAASVRHPAPLLSPEPQNRPTTDPWPTGVSRRELWCDSGYHARTTFCKRNKGKGLVSVDVQSASISCHSGIIGHCEVSDKIGVMF